MTEKTPEAARIDRLFLIAFIPALIFLGVSFYIRMTRDVDPLWTEFATPLLCLLLGLRAVVHPASPETRKASRVAGYLLLAITAVLVAVIIYKSLGA